MSITNYAKFIIKQLKLNIKINYDRKKLNGTPRKILNSSVAKKYGWKPKINLKLGFKKVYSSYIKEEKNEKNVFM